MSLSVEAISRELVPNYHPFKIYIPIAEKQFKLSKRTLQTTQMQ
jgi:hypothetical protein